MLKKIKNKLLLLWHGLMFGLKDADIKLLQQKGNKKYDNDEINKQIEQNGVFADFLNVKETDDVKEYRDSYYRVLREADKYIVNGEFNETTGWFDNIKTSKKTEIETQHVLVDESDGLPIKLIQFNKPIIKGTTDVHLYDNGESDMQYLFNLEYNAFTPKFRFDKYIKKIVVKKTNNSTKYIIDVYISIYPRQFMKVDDLFTKEMKNIFDKKNYTNDLINFSSLSFVTEKAYKADDMYEFKYLNKKVIDISVFDGNYIIKYEVDALIDGLDLVEKYRTESMDKKYSEKAPKSNILTLDLAERIYGNNIKS